jgi:perosamine synthetase
VQLPITRCGYTNVRWLYTVILSEDVVRSRDEVVAALEADGIETRPVFYAVHRLPPYRDPTAKMPVSERLSANGISLPTHGHLTDDDIGYIAERFRSHVT